MTDAPTSFESLLQRLGERGSAASGYERLRSRLVTFFRLRFAASAETLADQALDRLGRRLADGTSVENLEAYVLGIARLLVLEEQHREHKARGAALDAYHEQALHRVPEPDPALPALRECLQAQGPAAAAFILDYYATEGGADRIEHRQRLAAAAGVSLNVLRNRALRVRLALEKCVRLRLQGVDGSPSPRGDEIRNLHTVNSVEDDTTS